MTELHLSDKRLIKYVTRNEQPALSVDHSKAELHLSACQVCQKRYQLMISRYDKLDNIVKNPTLHFQKIYDEYLFRQKVKKNLIFAFSVLILTALIIFLIALFIN